MVCAHLFLPRRGSGLNKGTRDRSVFRGSPKVVRRSSVLFQDETADRLHAVLSGKPGFHMLLFSPEWLPCWKTESSTMPGENRALFRKPNGIHWTSRCLNRTPERLFWRFRYTRTQSELSMICAPGKHQVPMSPPAHHHGQTCAVT